MALFAPHRVLGEIASDCAFSIHRRGVETYATCASQRTFHVFDLKKLTLSMLGSIHPGDLSVIETMKDFTFAVCSGRTIYCSRRVHITCELVGHRKEVVRLFKFGKMLVSVDKEDCVMVWDVSEQTMRRREREYASFTSEIAKEAREIRNKRVIEKMQMEKKMKSKSSDENEGDKDSKGIPSLALKKVKNNVSLKNIRDELMRNAPWNLRKFKRLDKARDLSLFKDNKGKKGDADSDDDDSDDDTFKRVRDMEQLDPDAITGRRYVQSDEEDDSDDGNDSDDEDEEKDSHENGDSDDLEEEENEDTEEDLMDLAPTIVELPKEFGDGITSIAHPDTYVNKIVLANKRGKLLLLNIVTGRAVKILGGVENDLETNDAEITFVHNSPALDVMAIGFTDGRCVLYDINKERTIMTLNHGCKVTCCSFNDQGNQDDNDPLIVVCDVNGTITTWDLEKRRQRDLNQRAHDGEIISCYFFPGQPLLMTSARDNSLKQWAYDQSDGSSRLLKFRCGHSKPPNLVTFYADGKRIFASGSDRSLRIWSTIQDQQSKEFSQSRTASRAKRMRIHEEELKLPMVSHMSWNELREHSWANIASCHEKENKVYTWRLGNGILGEHVLEAPAKDDDRSICTSCAISQCGSYCFVSYESGAVRRFNLQSGAHRGELKRNVGGADASKIDKNALTKSLKGNEGFNFPGGKKSIWAYSGPQLGNIIDSRYMTLAHDGKCSLVQTDGRNRYVCTAGEDAKVRIWKYVDLKLDGEIDIGSPALPGTGFLHKTAELFAIATEDGTIRLFDIGTKKRVRTFRLNKDKKEDNSEGDEITNKKRKKKSLVLATKVEITSDRDWVVSCDTLGMLKVFDIPSARLLQTMKMGGDKITNFALSPTLEYIATTHAGKRGVFLWNNRTLFSTTDDLEDVVESIGGTVELEAPKISTLADEDDGNLLSYGQANTMIGDDDDDIDMVLDAADEMEIKEVDPWEKQKRELMASIPAQLGPGMATLSLLPKKQWQMLNDLDKIRAQRKINPEFTNLDDKGKDDDRDDFGQVRAPFFLPTKADEGDLRNSTFIVDEKGTEKTDDALFGTSSSRILRKDDDGNNMMNADCELLKRLKTGAREIELAENDNNKGKKKKSMSKPALRTSPYDGPYSEALQLLLTSSPERIESEIKSIGPWDSEISTESEIEEIAIALDFFAFEVKSGMNYDAIQAILSVFLKSHAETIARNQSLRLKCRVLNEIVTSSWERLDLLFCGVRATFAHLSGAL